MKEVIQDNNQPIVKQLLVFDETEPATKEEIEYLEAQCTSERQVAFAYALVREGENNKGIAYREAYKYKGRNAAVLGCMLLRNRPDVRKLYDRLCSVISNDNFKVTIDDIERYWKQVLSGEIKATVAERNKVTELVGRAKGMFIDRTEVTGKDGEPLVVNFAHMHRGKTDKEDGVEG